MSKFFNVKSKKCSYPNSQFIMTNNRRFRDVLFMYHIEKPSSILPYCIPKDGAFHLGNSFIFELFSDILLCR